MFELFMLLCIIGYAVEAAVKAGKKTSLAPTLAQEAGMSLTAYLEWQGWKDRVRVRGGVTIALALVGGVLFVGLSSDGGPSTTAGDILLGVCVLVPLFAARSYLVARNREAELRP